MLSRCFVPRTSGIKCLHICIIVSDIISLAHGGIAVSALVQSTRRWCCASCTSNTADALCTHGEERALHFYRNYSTIGMACESRNKVSWHDAPGPRVCHLAHRHVWFRPHLTATCRHYGHETSPSLTPKGRGRLARQLAPSTLSTCYEPCSKAIACSTLVASVVQSCKRSCKRCLRCLGLSQAALRLCAASCHTCANAALASSKSRPA